MVVWHVPLSSLFSAAAATAQESGTQSWDHPAPRTALSHPAQPVLSAQDLANPLAPAALAQL